MLLVQNQLQTFVWKMKSWHLSGCGPFQVLKTKKIYQRILNYVNLSVLMLEKLYLHQNGVEYPQEFGWESNQGCKPAKISLPPTKLMFY